MGGATGAEGGAADVPRGAGSLLAGRAQPTAIHGRGRAVGGSGTDGEDYLLPPGLPRESNQDCCHATPEDLRRGRRFTRACAGMTALFPGFAHQIYVLHCLQSSPAPTLPPME